jgi:hypothetical protein
MTVTTCTLPDTYQTRQALYVSPSMTIGKHEWCCVVYRHGTYGACTDYHWRKIYPANLVAACGPARWTSEKGWPRYNGNDTYNGLPRRLRILWERHRPQIETALAFGRGGAS